MTDEIKYEDMQDKKIPDFVDPETKMLKDAAVKGIEKKQIAEQTKIEMGIVSPPKDFESVPKEVPALFFKFGSKILKCEKFRTDDEENKMIGKHLSIIIGAQNSKIYSGIVILIIVISKLTDCIDAIRNLLKKKEKKEEKSTNDIYNEQKNADVTG